MVQQRLLFVVADKLVAFHWRSGELDVEAEFAADEGGLAAFAAYLRQRRGSLFSLLANVVDESFQSERIPYLQGSDREALIKRKLGQFFHGTPFSAAIRRGRETTGRRDEKLLFIALTRPQQFAAWLTTLRNSESRLAGFYSIPLLAAPLLDKAEAAAPGLLLVCRTRGGLRQIFFERGLLRFARLSPLVTDSVEAAAIATANESAHLYQYLASQQLIEPGVALAVQVLAHPADRLTIAAHCRDTDELHFTTIDLLAKARQAGLKTLPTDSHSDLLFLHWLATKRPPEQLATVPERHYYQLWQLRRTINGIATAVLLVCVLWSVRQWFEAARLDKNAAQIQRQTATDRQRYEAIMATLPPLALRPDNLRALVGQFDGLEKHSASLAATYIRVSRAMQETPTIELDGIDWQISNNPEEGLQAPGNNATTVAAGSIFAVADIHGVLPAAMSGDHRALLDTVNAFADRLRLDGAAQVRILSMPFDIESGKTLHSDSTPAIANTAPRFSLRLLQKL